jgi:hypothetical protein
MGAEEDREAIDALGVVGSSWREKSREEWVQRILYPKALGTTWGEEKRRGRGRVSGAWDLQLHGACGGGGGSAGVAAANDGQDLCGVHEWGGPIREGVRGPWVVRCWADGFGWA